MIGVCVPHIYMHILLSGSPIEHGHFQTTAMSGSPIEHGHFQTTAMSGSPIEHGHFQTTAMLVGQK